MRESNVRGKAIDSGEWLYGDVQIPKKKGVFIFYVG